MSATEILRQSSDSSAQKSNGLVAAAQLGIRNRVDWSPGKGHQAVTSRIVSPLILFVIFLPAVGHPEQTASVEQQIRKMETTRLAFPKDSSRWANDIADDALFMQGTGVMLNKRQTIENYRNLFDDNSTDLTETEFRQSGDTAIFSYVSTRIRHDDKNGAIRHQHVRRTVVYHFKDGKWRLVLLSAAGVPYLDVSQRPVDPKILDEYVGVYADFPSPKTVTFTRDGTRLMAQGTGETEKTELLALSDDTFAVRGEPNQLYFERGPDGHVLRLWYRDSGGDQLVQRRISK
jgi:ketosteroid isomerase-like protein